MVVNLALLACSPKKIVDALKNCWLRYIIAISEFVLTQHPTRTTSNPEHKFAFRSCNKPVRIYVYTYAGGDATRAIGSTSESTGKD